MWASTVSPFLPKPDGEFRERGLGDIAPRGYMPAILDAAQRYLSNKPELAASKA
jgi:hypothetical protein